MLENYDTRLQIADLGRVFEAEHAQEPYASGYAAGVRKAYAAFIDPAGEARSDAELRGILDAVLTVVEEVGLESAQFLLSVDPRNL